MFRPFYPLSRFRFMLLEYYSGLLNTFLLYAFVFSFSIFVVSRTYTTIDFINTLLILLLATCANKSIRYQLKLDKNITFVLFEILLIILILLYNPIYKTQSFHFLWLFAFSYALLFFILYKKYEIITKQEIGVNTVKDYQNNFISLSSIVFIAFKKNSVARQYLITLFIIKVIILVLTGNGIVKFMFSDYYFVLVVTPMMIFNYFFNNVFSITRPIYSHVITTTSDVNVLLSVYFSILYRLLFIDLAINIVIFTFIYFVFPIYFYRLDLISIILLYIVVTIALFFSGMYFSLITPKKFEKLFGASSRPSTISILISTSISFSLIILMKNTLLGYYIFCAVLLVGTYFLYRRMPLLYKEYNKKAFEKIV